MNNPLDQAADPFSSFPPLQFIPYPPPLNPNPSPNPNSTLHNATNSQIPNPYPASTNNLLSFTVPKKRRRGPPQRKATSFLIPPIPNLTLNGSNGPISSSFRPNVEAPNSLPQRVPDSSEEIIVINKESTSEALIALSAGFPADSLTEEEIDTGVVPIIGGIEQVNYILIRNHIIAKWRENVSNWVTKEMFIDDIPKHCHALLDSTYTYLVSYGFINFGVATAIKEKVPAEPSKTSAIVIGAGLAGLAAARQLLRFGFQVTVLGGRKQAGGGFTQKKWKEEIGCALQQI